MTLAPLAIAEHLACRVRGGQTNCTPALARFVYARKQRAVTRCRRLRAAWAAILFPAAERVRRRWVGSLCAIAITRYVYLDFGQKQLDLYAPNTIGGFFAEGGIAMLELYSCACWFVWFDRQGKRCAPLAGGDLLRWRSTLKNCTPKHAIFRQRAAVLALVAFLLPVLRRWFANSACGPPPPSFQWSVWLCCCRLLEDLVCYACNGTIGAIHHHWRFLPPYACLYLY